MTTQMPYQRSPSVRTRYGIMKNAMTTCAIAKTVRAMELRRR